MYRCLMALCLALGLYGPASAQAPKPSMFSTREACEVAVLSGNFSSYEPKNFVLKGKNPRPGSKVDSIRIERPMCINLLTFQGWQWVAEESGMMLLTCDGTICGLASCWNPGKDYFFPEPSLMVAKTLRGERGEKGDKGDMGPRGLMGPQGPSGRDGTTTTVREGGMPWWGNVLIAAGLGLVGGFVYNELHGGKKNEPSPTCTDPKANNFGQSGICKYPTVTSDSSVVTNKPCSNGLGNSCMRASLVREEPTAT